MPYTLPPTTTHLSLTSPHLDDCLFLCIYHSNNNDNQQPALHFTDPQHHHGHHHNTNLHDNQYTWTRNDAPMHPHYPNYSTPLQHSPIVLLRYEIYVCPISVNDWKYMTFM